MKKLLTALLISMLLLISVSGCQDNNRRAELVGIDNLRLQIKEKDTKIAELQSELDKCEDKNKQVMTQSTKAGVGFMEIFAKANEKALKLEKENAILKAKIKELEK